MRKSVTVTKETDTGRNTCFKDTKTKNNMYLINLLTKLKMVIMKVLITFG
jgi:hypothetical protein